jgi:hypothetical protein
MAGITVIVVESAVITNSLDAKKVAFFEMRPSGAAQT